jgi:hypothetical protein
VLRDPNPSSDRNEQAVITVLSASAIRRARVELRNLSIGPSRTSRRRAIRATLRSARAAEWSCHRDHLDVGREGLLYAAARAGVSRIFDG